MRRKRSKIANMEVVIHGPRKDHVREEIRAASSTMLTKKETGMRRRSRSQSETSRHSKGDGKRRSQRERTQKVPVRQEKQMNRSALTCHRENAKWNPHVIIGTHQNAHTTNPKVDVNGRNKCVFKHTGKACEKMPWHRTRQRNSIVYWVAAPQLRSQYDRYWGMLEATQKEAIQSSILSQCAKTLPYSREMRAIARNYPARAQKCSRSERPTQTWICINSRLNFVKTRVAAWELRNIMCKIRGTYQKTRIPFSKRRLLQERLLGQESAMKKKGWE